jgi:hypothetical protein
MYFNSEEFNQLIQRKVNITFLLNDEGVGPRTKDLLHLELIQVEQEIKDFAESAIWAY